MDGPYQLESLERFVLKEERKEGRMEGRKTKEGR
jgi:hypothetical protein